MYRVSGLPFSRKDQLCRRGSRTLPLLEALATKHRPALRRLERDRCFALTPRADGFGFYPFGVSSATLREAKVLRSFSFAVFAALGFVFELFIVEEELLTRSEDEV